MMCYQWKRQARNVNRQAVTIYRQAKKTVICQAEKNGYLSGGEIRLFVRREKTVICQATFFYPLFIFVGSL